MANEINGTELRFDIIKEVTEGVTPTTGTREDLPASTGQAPLTYEIAKVVDDTRRANRETAAPTDGAGMVQGSVAVSLRPCEALDTLIESAISGVFDATSGVAVAGETDVTFTMFTTLTDRAGRYLGYQDKGNTVTSMSISNSASSDDSVSAEFEIMGLSRTRLTTENTLAVTPATTQAFNYIDVGNLTVDGQTLEFTDLSFSTGTPRAARRVFGKRDATSMAPSGNRETTLTIKALRRDFNVDALVVGEPSPVSFDIMKNGEGYRVVLTYAKATIPTDELSDTGLLINIEFTAHAANDATPALRIEKL